MTISLEQLRINLKQSIDNNEAPVVNPQNDLIPRWGFDTEYYMGDVVAIGYAEFIRPEDNNILPYWLYTGPNPIIVDDVSIFNGDYVGK